MGWPNSTTGSIYYRTRFFPLYKSKSASKVVPSSFPWKSLVANGTSQMKSGKCY